jgi:hypothetical protein
MRKGLAMELGLFANVLEMMQKCDLINVLPNSNVVLSK